MFTYQKDLNVFSKADILVAGGGPSGVAAAVAAARCGKKVIFLEQVAGRCIGADRPMQASTRVIPCCYITGQAAGVAAAVCIEDKTNARDADVDKIKKIINEVLL